MIQSLINADLTGCKESTSVEESREIILLFNAEVRKLAFKLGYVIDIDETSIEERGTISEYNIDTAKKFIEIK